MPNGFKPLAPPPAPRNPRPPPAAGPPLATGPGTTAAAGQAQAHWAEGNLAHGSATPVAADPTKGTKAADLAEQRAALAHLSPAELEARKASLKQQAALFSKEKMEASTASLSPAEAAEQRIANARKLITQMEALGMHPEAEMDVRVVQAAEQQQEMVDQLATDQAGLTPEMLKAAQLARAQRSLGDGKVTQGDRGKLDAALKAAGLTREALDQLPAEKRLLIAGFSPDEIADHFTARDKDADVVADRNNVDPSTPKRGDPGIPIGGDKNMDGTVRRPMTTAEADRCIDINSVLDEAWHVGNKFGKIISNDVVARNMKGERPPALYGDVGEKLNTDRSPDRSRPATGAEQVQAAGLDYNTSKFTNATGTQMADFVKNNQVHRLEGTIDDEIASKAEVCLGAGVYARAQKRASVLEQARQSGATGDQGVFVPKMLRTSAAEDSGDNLPGIMTRPRGDAGANTTNAYGPEAPHPEIDPKSGLGYSVTERLNLPVIPNQERTMRGATQFAGRVNDAQITRSDTRAPMLVLAPDGKTMIPNPSLSAADKAFYTDPKFGT